MPSSSALADLSAAGVPGDYWRHSRRPLTSLAFILPALFAYEAGARLLGPRALRNGADLWLRALLDQVGLEHYFLLPMLTVALLMAWHHTTRERWHVSLPVLAGMLLECAVMGLVLVSIGRLQAIAAHTLAGAAADHAAVRWGALAQWSAAVRLIGFLGAGIYEELLFRLTLLPIAIAACGRLRWSEAARLAGAIVITSLVFSGAHYLGPLGERFDTYSFVFRSLAGGFFGMLFVHRGFGIAAGTHALYDIFVGVL